MKHTFYSLLPLFLLLDLLFLFCWRPPIRATATPSRS